MNWFSRNFWWFYVTALVGAFAFGMGKANASTYVRDGGTADYLCCSDKACTSIISQHADAVRARDACGALTDADGVTRYTRSNAFRITRSPTSPPTQPPTQSSAKLAWSSSLTGTYADLAGATVSGSVAVRIANAANSTTDCANILAGPWTFTIDGAQTATENTCPFGTPDDSTLADTKKLANGAHTMRATSPNLAQPITVTFTVNNATPPPANGSATLTWTAPTTNTDGTALTELAGYRILYGTSPSALTSTVEVPNPSARSYVVDKLAAGTWYFTARAYTSAGGESVNSNTTSKVIAP